MDSIEEQLTEAARKYALLDQNTELPLHFGQMQQANIPPMLSGGFSPDKMGKKMRCCSSSVVDSSSSEFMNSKQSLPSAVNHTYDKTPGGVL